MLPPKPWARMYGFKVKTLVGYRKGKTYATEGIFLPAWAALA